MVKTIIVFFLFFIVGYSHAQQGLSLQATVFNGKNISHSQIRSVKETAHWGVSLDINKMTEGKKYWQFAHNFPQMGLLFTYRTLGNHKIYGEAVSVLPYIELNVLRSKYASLQIKHGTGLAYVTKRYDVQKNPSNQLLSTRLNATSILDAGLAVPLTPRFTIKGGAILHHISNGGFQLPNSGINTLSAYFNSTYYLTAKPAAKKLYEPQKEFKRIRYRVAFSQGIHKKPYQQKIVINPQLSGLAMLQHNTRFRTGAGIETGKPYGYKTQLALYVEEEVQLGRLVTKYGFGAYLLNKRKPGEDFYSKIGIAYYPAINQHIPQKFYFGLMLKAHRYVAAHIETTVGYTF